ncbi:MAG: glycosyltransferase family 2 protein [Bacteroidaceae bacterium]|nr:glycosyltransferase family 2 protein [Bacteroidaceae bacterium]
MATTLSIIIPAYNEGANLAAVLKKVLKVQLPNGMGKEIIVVNDGSTDDTVAHAEAFVSANPLARVLLLNHSINMGKGMAIRTALPAVSGDYVVIQDADEELDPNDYVVMLNKMFSDNLPVVYGSRFLVGGRQGSRFFYYGNRVLTALANVLYGQHLTDEATCYKMFSTPLLKSVNLKCCGFEFCPEVTAKIARQGVKIQEVPISYFPRTRQQGKKVRLIDGLKAAWYLIKYRFSKL